MNTNMTAFLIGIYFVLIGLTTCAEVVIKNHQDLMDAAVNGFLTCSSELNLNIDTCTDLLDSKIDHSDKKYDGCKCIMPCVGKKIGTMDVENGKWNEEKYWEIIKLLEVPEWKEQGEIIGKNCVDKVNTHCSAGYPIFQCAMKHSKMFQSMSEGYLKHKQANLEAANNTNIEYEDV
ncbi:Pheromone/general odorant binding protein [Cinara cedri]|uniref:Pheromone/general odorant binding protein n=1 Tax=Cinara cedri TaxID=506608 RepID=A0A5E4M3B6_9HEMI|nr:Pheromone/general odorant binding protein [Cinara cedri]